jgi:hypothetical protein
MIHLHSRPKPARPEPRHTAGAIAAQHPDGPPPSPPEPPGDPFTARPGPPQPVPGGTGPRPRFIPIPPPETCQTCGSGLDEGRCGWCGPRTAAPSHVATRLAAVVFWHDRRDLPVFRQTVRARGWNGLHLRAPAMVSDRWTARTMAGGGQ